MIQKEAVDKGSDISTPQLSLPVLAGKVGENWFDADIKFT